MDWEVGYALTYAGPLVTGHKRPGQQSPNRSPGNQQVLCEGPLRIDPLSLAPESCTRCHLWNFFGLVLVRTFCPDGLVFVQHDAQARSRNMNSLSPRRTQMHLDTPLGEIPERLVPETAQIKIRTQLPVDVRQQIQIERRRHACGIVVSQHLQLHVLLQVRAE